MMHDHEKTTAKVSNIQMKIDLISQKIVETSALLFLYAKGGKFLQKNISQF